MSECIYDYDNHVHTNVESRKEDDRRTSLKLNGIVWVEVGEHIQVIGNYQDANFIENLQLIKVIVRKWFQDNKVHEK